MIQLAKTDQQDRVYRVARHTPCLGPRVMVDWQIAHENPKMPHRFYLDENDALIELTGRGAVICGAPVDQREAALFLSCTGANRILSDGWSPPKWQVSRHAVMQKPPEHPAECEIPQGLDRNPSTEDILKVLESSEPICPQASRDGFYADLCARRNRGLACVYGIRRQGVLLSTAGIYAVNDQEAYLACVETCPEARGKGFASALVRVLCHEYSDKQVTLMCREYMCGFYKSMGFRKRKTGGVMAQTDEPLPEIPGLREYLSEKDDKDLETR